jgi:hypothetical protein
MKKFLMILLICLSASHISFSQVGQDFPSLIGKTLKDATVNLPSDTKGKMTLLGLAYSQKSQGDLESWFQPIYTNFVEEHKGSLFPTDSYDINIYFVPMTKGLPVGADKIKDYLNKELDPELQKYVLLYDGELKEYKDKLKLGAKDLPYFFLLDEKGKIVYQTSGVYSEDKMNQIMKKLDAED